MSPAEFIYGLMRKDSHGLAFLPQTVLLENWISQGNFIIQTDPFGRPAGFLLHSPVSDQGTLYVSHAALDVEPAQRSSAKDVVAKLVKRAAKARATHILLQCASELDSIEFWISCAFVPVAIAPHGHHPRRMIIQLERSLHSPQKKLAGGTLPDSRRPNA